MPLPKQDIATLSATWTEGVLLKRDVFSTVERGRFQTSNGEVEAVLRRLDQVPWWSYLPARHLFERERKALTDSCLEAMDALTPEMVDDAVAAMSDVLTEDELTQLAAFYESPVGQSIVAKNAQISAAMAGPMRAMMPKVSAQILKRFCARIDCSTLPKPPPPQQS